MLPNFLHPKRERLLRNNSALFMKKLLLLVLSVVLCCNTLPAQSFLGKLLGKSTKVENVDSAATKQAVATDVLGSSESLTNALGTLWNEVATDKDTASVPAQQTGLSNLVGKLTGTGTAETITNVLGSLIGNSLTLSEKMLEGTWIYSGTSCVLESDEALSNIGGTLVTSQIEEKLDANLAKVGVKEGSCSFTFIGTDSCTLTIGSHTLQGNYTLNAEEKKIDFEFYGLLTMNSFVSYDVTSLSIVFDADKLLNLVQKTIGTVSDYNSKYGGLVKSAAATGTTTATLNTVSGLLNNYDGMMLGLRLKR